MECDGRKERGCKTREKILASALQILGESGHEGLTSQALIEKAGISKGNLYHHFKTLDEVPVAAFEAILEELQSLVDVNFDMVEWNEKHLANTDNVDTAIIRELQTSLWLQDGTSKAFIAGDAIVAQLKQLNP